MQPTHPRKCGYGQKVICMRDSLTNAEKWDTMPPEVGRVGELITFHKASEMADWEPDEERIPGLLDRGLVLLVAPEGSGKTFMAIHMGVHIASGMKWQGQEVEQGIVLYCIAEGVSFFPFRVTTALDHIRATGDKAPFYIYGNSLNLRTDDKGKLSPDVERLCDSVAVLEGTTGLRTKLIVFDTLNRFMPGGDENNQAECGGLVHGCEYLKNQLDTTVMLVHHTRKDGKAVRGNTVLTGAADQILVCNRDKDEDLTATPMLVTTRGFGKRKDRDPVEQWFQYKKTGMSKGTMWRYEEEADDIRDFLVMVKEKKYYHDTGDVEWVYTDVVQDTLVVEPCSPPDKVDSPVHTEVLDLLKKEGEMGVTAIMRHTGKAQRTVYSLLDKLVDANLVIKDPTTKRYRWSDPNANPFEEV